MAGDPKDSQLPRSGFTRRSFLKSAGLASAGAASAGLLQDLSAQMAQSQQEKVLGPDAAPITLRVNGQTRQLSVEPRTTLAEALRDSLHLTGTKIVCDRGSCSACTVMLNDKPVCSCMTLAMDAVGHDVTTIEGIGSAEHLHPVQAAFIKHDGMQCGFCTPGMVMSCTHLVRSNPNPTAADVKTAISGNICRCGTYPKVIDAALSAPTARNGA